MQRDKTDQKLGICLKMVKKMYLLLLSGERVRWSDAGCSASAYVSCQPVSSGSEAGRADFKRSRVPPGSHSHHGLFRRRGRAVACPGTGPAFLWVSVCRMVIFAVAEQPVRRESFKTLIHFVKRQLVQMAVCRAEVSFLRSWCADGRVRRRTNKSRFAVGGERVAAGRRGADGVTARRG